MANSIVIQDTTTATAPVAAPIDKAPKPVVKPAKAVNKAMQRPTAPAEVAAPVAPATAPVAAPKPVQTTANPATQRPARLAKTAQQSVVAEAKTLAPVVAVPVSEEKKDDTTLSNQLLTAIALLDATARIKADPLVLKTEKEKEAAKIALDRKPECKELRQKWEELNETLAELLKDTKNYFNIVLAFTDRSLIELFAVENEAGDRKKFAIIELNKSRKGNKPHFYANQPYFCVPWNQLTPERQEIFERDAIGTKKFYPFDNQEFVRNNPL